MHQPAGRGPDLTSAGGRPDDDGDGIWSALADPTRRRLLDQLSSGGPLSATELAPDYPVSRQAIVKHLAALSGAGLLEAERTGREVRYRVVPDRLDGATSWLSQVGERWDRRLETLRRRVENAPDQPGGA